MQLTFFKSFALVCFLVHHFDSECKICRINASSIHNRRAWRWQCALYLVHKYYTCNTFKKLLKLQLMIYDKCVSKQKVPNLTLHTFLAIFASAIYKSFLPIGETRQS